MASFYCTDANLFAWGIYIPMEFLNRQPLILGLCVNLSCGIAVIVPSVIASSRYELLHVLNFDPVRRRMSVIVRCSSGELQMTLALLQPNTILWQTFGTHATHVYVGPPQATRCSSAKAPTPPFSPASNRRRWRGSARTWSAMQQWVTCAASLCTSSAFEFKAWLYELGLRNMFRCMDRKHFIWAHFAGSPGWNLFSLPWTRPVPALWAQSAGMA